MTDKTDRPADGAPAPVTPKSTAPKPQPKKGFDPESLRGGKHPGGKPQRGSKTLMHGKSRGRG